jgi:hypothetical protein
MQFLSTKGEEAEMEMGVAPTTHLQATLSFGTAVLVYWKGSAVVVHPDVEPMNSAKTQ